MLERVVTVDPRVDVLVVDDSSPDGTARLVAAVRSSGYCFQVEMTHRTWQEGFRVVELPIIFTERAAGASKMSRRIVAEALLRVALWSVTGGRHRARVRHPLSVTTGQLS